MPGQKLLISPCKIGLPRRKITKTKLKIRTYNAHWLRARVGKGPDWK